MLVLCDDAAGDDTTGASHESFKLDVGIRDKCLRILREGMRGEEFWPAIHAAEGLTLAGKGSEVREFLAPKLGQEKDDQKRCGIARELVRAGDRKSAKVMLDILAGDDPYGHVHAAESLYKVNEVGDGSAMKRGMRQNENKRLKLMAAAALGRNGDGDAMKILREHLTDDDPELRRTAAWILGRIGDDTDIPRLKKTLDRAEDAFTRCYSEHSLAALGDEEGLKALAENLSSKDPAIRTYAATFAGDARATRVAGRLIELLDDENVDVRVRAAQSLLVLSQPVGP